MVFCRICGRKAENGRECNRCAYFLERGADEFVIRRMLSDDKTKSIWNKNEKIAEDLARTYYDHLIENYNQKQVKKHSKEHFGFNTFVDGIKLGLDIITPLLDEEKKAEVDEKIKSMLAFRKWKDSNKLK